jgi:hypothetical protein
MSSAPRDDAPPRYVHSLVLPLWRCRQIERGMNGSWSWLTNPIKLTGRSMHGVQGRRRRRKGTAVSTRGEGRRGPRTRGSSCSPSAARRPARRCPPASTCPSTRMTWSCGRRKRRAGLARLARRLGVSARLEYQVESKGIYLSAPEVSTVETVVVVSSPHLGSWLLDRLIWVGAPESETFQTGVGSKSKPCIRFFR